MNSRKKKQLILSVVGLIATLFYVYALPERLFDLPFSSVIQSSDGRLLSAKIASDGQWRFAPNDTLPYKFKTALIHFEDRRFYKHLGVDLLAVGRAIKQNIAKKGVVSGASTLTMQTIRLSRNQNRTIKEKIIEAILASRLELRHSKDEILSLYASNAPFGGNVIGLNAAAWRYFGQSADVLSWAESAMLAVLPNAPSLIHLGKNRDLLLKKRNSLLDRLWKNGVIDSVECELAKEESLPDKPYPIPMMCPHLLDQIGDTTLRSTIDYDLQSRVLRIAGQHNKIHRTNKVENLATIIIEVQTGKVVAYVGNIYDGSDRTRGSYVDVIPAPRSSGSVLKPFLYAAMLDNATLLPTMLFPDIPTYYKGFTPQNYNHNFDGAVPANRVLERSLNVPSVRMLDLFGREKFLYILQKLGFSTIQKSADHYGLSLILGGAEVTVWDLARTYTLLASKLNNVKEIKDVTYRETTKTVSNNSLPLSKASIWLTFNALTNVNRPEEEGDWHYFDSSRKIGWKTGTSYGNRDAWAVGVTPQYVVCTWVGNCSGEGRSQLTGVGYAAPLMFDLFSLLPRTNWFHTPEIELDSVLVCSKSGYRSTPLCESVDTLLLPKISHQAPSCPFHKTVHLSSDLKYRVTSDCYDPSKIKQCSWFVLPPIQEWYYRRANIDYKPLPPPHRAMKLSEADNPIDLIYPRNNRVVVIPKGLSGEQESIVFSAVHSDASISIFWHIDDQYIGTTIGSHKLSYVPTQGKHRLTLIDERGNRRSIIFHCNRK